MRRLDRDAILHCNELTGTQAYGVLARPLGFKVACHHHALSRMVPPNTTLVRSVHAGIAISRGLSPRARSGVADSVVFAGFLMPAEDNVAAFDLLLAPTLEEPFGRTPIEAALVGTPYLATDDAGHGEIGRRWGGGRLVPRDASAEDCARQAAAILDDPSAVVLSQAARSRVAAEFSVASHAAAVEGIYATL